MIASASSAVITGGLSGWAPGSAGSANATGAPKPPTTPTATALHASPPVTMRSHPCRFVPVCNVITPPAASGSLTASRPAGTGSLSGADDLGAYRDGQTLVPIRIGIQIPGVTRRLWDALGLKRADQRPVGRAELHLRHHV